MSVITISREAGSGGTAIAKAVAETLGYRFVDKQILGELLGKYGLVSFNKVYDNAPAFWDSFDSQKAEQRSTIVVMMNKAILAIAKMGNAVIVGRGGYVILGGYADVLNVRIQATLATRIKSVQKEHGLDDFKVAERDVKERDHIRTVFMESAYSMKVEPAQAFDLVINAEKITPEKATEIIVDVARSLGKNPSGTERLASKIEIDPVLADAVREALGC